jgi:hypothetical protein
MRAIEVPLNIESKNDVCMIIQLGEYATLVSKYILLQTLNKQEAAVQNIPFNSVRRRYLMAHWSSECEMWYEEMLQSFLEMLYEPKSTVFWDVT